MSGFVHLNVHSCFSPQWGIRSLEDICAAAREMGMEYLALTDRNGLYGIPRFLETAREFGLKPLIGAEAVHQKRRAVLLVRNPEGYANLCRLISDLHCSREFDLAKALSAYRRGLFIVSDDEDLLRPLARQCRGNIYVELSPGHRMHRALALSREMKLPPLATSRAVLLDENDWELHRVLRAIALNSKLSRLAPQETACEGDPTALRKAHGRLFPPLSRSR